jgi:hypothetical protein
MKNILLYLMIKMKLEEHICKKIIVNLLATIANEHSEVFIDLIILG